MDPLLAEAGARELEGEVEDNEGLHSHHGRGRYTRGICQHFGRAPTFTMVDLDTGTVQVLTNISEQRGGSGLLTDRLRNQGFQVMIVGGLGPKAVQNFAEQCVEVFIGATGTVKDAIEDWRKAL